MHSLYCTRIPPGVFVTALGGSGGRSGGAGGISKSTGSDGSLASLGSDAAGGCTLMFEDCDEGSPAKRCTYVTM